MSSPVSKKSSASKNLINQITLNCLMNTSQMMKLKNIKEKEDIASNRIKKMRKYNNELLELFKKLLNGKGSISLNDSFNEFIDKAIHHLDMLYDLKDEELDETNNTDELETEEFEKSNDDIIDALNVDLNEIMNEYEKRKCLEQKQEELEKELERERAKKEEEDEYDEDVEY